MPILNILTTPVEGLVGISPQIIYINTSDTVAQVTAAGYLNSSKSQGFTYAGGVGLGTASPFNPNLSQMALVVTTDAGAQWYQISVASGTGIITLIPDVSPGNVLLPVTVNRIASFTNVAGQIGDVAATINHLGSIAAGTSGAPGTFISFPAAAASGTLIFSASNNVTGNFNTTVTNTSVGQATVYSLPDPANAAGRILVGATATPFTANHSLVASGTGGLIADAGYQLKTVAGAAVAGGAASQNVVDAFCTAASNIVANWNTSTNAVTIQKVTPGVGSFTVLSSGDPGASTLNYIITKTT